MIGIFAYISIALHWPKIWKICQSGKLYYYSCCCCIHSISYLQNLRFIISCLEFSRLLSMKYVWKCNEIKKDLQLHFKFILWIFRHDCKHSRPNRISFSACIFAWICKVTGWPENIWIYFHTNKEILYPVNSTFWFSIFN